jgi:hypothetical protein
LVLLNNVYTLSSTKLEIRAKQFLFGSEGWGGEGGSRGKGGLMTKTLYAHMNKRNKTNNYTGYFIVTLPSIYVL